MYIELSPLFQFHKGTIKTMNEIGIYEYLNCFNSIKVRLKQLMPSLESLRQQFQFHKGTIKTRQRFVLQGDIERFNSIKVRLKLLSQFDKLVIERVFQFHKGTIKTSFW